MEELKALEFKKMILEDLDSIYGLGVARNTIENYLEFAQLYATEDIKDIGNFNIFLNVPDNFKSTTKLLEVIHSILDHYDIVKTPYHTISRDEMRKLKSFDEDMLIINEDTGIYMKTLLNMINYYICKNTNKIFIFIYSESSRIIKPNDADSLLSNFTWLCKVSGQLSLEDKKKLISEKLLKNNVKVSTKCDFIDKLSKCDLTKVESEVLYAIVKCRANKVDTITNDFLEQIHRPQYMTHKKVDDKSAMKELEEMIGLELIKKQIKQIVNYVKVNKSRNQLPMLHMAFLGPSGVGKTECARLVARIFYEEGILSKDNFIEASRVDLVGAYIGHTAIQTQKVINSALGGTLLIDEAYALDPKSSEKDFGAESISTLIKAMEDHRQELCVILTGYEQPMEDLLKSNSGFSSRIQFKLHFKDYTPDELYQIFKKMVKDDKYKLDKNVKPILLEHFNQAQKQDNFGSARYVRSLLEKITMVQAQRVAEDTAADIDLIKAVDIKKVIEYLDKEKPKERLQIGFATAI